MIHEGLVHELASHRGDPVITSFYLDVDGRRFPRPIDFQPHLNALAHAGAARAGRWGGDVGASVAADLARIREWLTGGFTRVTTRGVVLFSDSTQGWFEAIELPVAVRDQVTVAPEPDVGQLIEVLKHHPRTLVALVDRRQGRLLRLELGEIEEAGSVVDEPERQVDTDVEVGGWLRRHEEAARRHFRRASALLVTEVRAWQPEAVVLSGSADDMAALRACLDREVSGRVIGTMSLPVTATAHDIEVAALDITRDVEAGHERALVDELLERAPVRRKAALGLPAVMSALGERRVGTLVVARGFAPAGARCPACGHVGPAACQCPECGTPSVQADDVIEVAIGQALAQGATVEVCESADLADFGGIGALERF